MKYSTEKELDEAGITKAFKVIRNGQPIMKLDKNTLQDEMAAIKASSDLCPPKPKATGVVRRLIQAVKSWGCQSEP